MKFIRKNWRFRESEQNWTTEDLCTFFAVIRFNGDRWRCFCCWVKWKPQNHLDIQNRKNHRTPTFFYGEIHLAKKIHTSDMHEGFFFSRFCTVFPHQHSIRTYASCKVNAFNELMQMHPIQSSLSNYCNNPCCVSFLLHQRFQSDSTIDEMKKPTFKLKRRNSILIALFTHETKKHPDFFCWCKVGSSLDGHRTIENWPMHLMVFYE